MNFNPENINFSEPRLQMGIVGRKAARLISYCFNIVLMATVSTFLLSDIKNFFWLGILGLLFLIDRLFHLNQADKPIFNGKNRTSRKINVAECLTPRTLEILERAMEKSLVTGGDFHLYLMKFLAENSDINEGLLRLDVQPKEFGKKIESLLEESRKNPDLNRPKVSRKDLTDKIETLVKTAYGLGLANDEKFIEPRTVFSALSFINSEKISRLLNLFSIAPNDLENALIFGRFRKKIGWSKNFPSALGGFANAPRKIRHRFMNRAWTAKPTPTLDKYGVDFTDLAREQKAGFLIGHEAEYGRMANILSQPTKANVLLVGESGSGKEALIAHLAFEIIQDKTPAGLFDKRLVALQIGNLVSGTSNEDISGKINKIVQEIISAGNIILYIPDIHNLAKTSGPEYMSAADILIPVITGDAFPVVAATYPREFQRIIESQSDFAAAFETVRVDEIGENEAVKLLTYDAVILENQYKIIVSFGAIKQSVILAHKYFRTVLLPSSAENLLKEALADASQKKQKVLSADDVIAIAERKINIPIHRAGKKEAEKLLNLENIIHEKLVDQEEAVKSVSRSLREYRSGLSRKGGPIAVFLFVGPTGVGKTELSKILAKIQFGADNMMLRFDMSEYQDKQSIYRFIGSPDGKIAGSLTEAVIQKPYCLILLDEFEKAHPDILNLFLQVFDDGRLTDNLGRTIDFTNTIIIATSNAHSEFIKTHIEAHTAFETITEELKKKLTDYFKPELLNRFSDIIVFKTLSPDDIEAICRLNLNDLAKNLSEVQGINLTFDGAAVKKIAELGFDPAFGARPLRGVISEKLRGVLAEKILKEEIVKGSDVKVILEGEEIKFV